MTDCAVEDCAKPRSGRSRHCGMHQARLQRTGTTDPGPAAHVPAAERLSRKTERTETCWLWTGYRTPFGHGQIVDDEGRVQYAHRLAWTLVHGPIPDGLVVRHQCDVPACVRIEHLVIGTQADNAADMAERGRSLKGRERDRRDYCTRELHEMTTANRTPDGRCGECRRVTRREQAAARRAA